MPRFLKRVVLAGWSVISIRKMWLSIALKSAVEIGQRNSTTDGRDQHGFGNLRFFHPSVEKPVLCKSLASPHCFDVIAAGQRRRMIQRLIWLPRIAVLEVAND
jgi:hypothetical protein